VINMSYPCRNISSAPGTRQNERHYQVSCLSYTLHFIRNFPLEFY